MGVGVGARHLQSALFPRRDLTAAKLLSGKLPTDGCPGTGSPPQPPALPPEVVTSCHKSNPPGAAAGAGGGGTAGPTHREVFFPFVRRLGFQVGRGSCVFESENRWVEFYPQTKSSRRRDRQRLRAPGSRAPHGGAPCAAGRPKKRTVERSADAPGLLGADGRPSPLPGDPARVHWVPVTMGGRWRLFRRSSHCSGHMTPGLTLSRGHT